MADAADLWRLSARDIAQLLARREVSPVELLDLALRRTGEINPQVNAIIHLNAGAHDAARASEARLARGEPWSPLDGIPFTVKDNILARGMPAAWGSRLFEAFVPEHDGLPVARLRAAGAVILGKTNVPEFTLEGYTGNLLFGVTRNPWDLGLTPGGSSGGAVASVALGLTPFAVATDGGGSIRRPASHTGLVGLKPSIGRVARDHSFPQILLDFEVVGPIARTVADAAMIYSAIAGPDELDRKSLFAQQPNGTADFSAPRERLRILYVPRFADAPLDREIADSVAAAARQLGELGHDVTEGVLPFALDDVATAWPVIAKTAVAYMLDQYPGAETRVADKFLQTAEEAAAYSAADYLDAIERINRFRRTVTLAFADVDVIMTPSAAALPWPAEKEFPTKIDGRPVGPRGHAVYTGWVNMCGHPAINLPAGPSRSGLPIGFQLVGRFGDDALLLRISQRYEEAFPWADRWPALANAGHDWAAS